MANYDDNYNNRSENNNVGFKEIAILALFVAIIVFLIVGIVYCFIVSNKDKKNAEDRFENLGVSYSTKNQNTDFENREIFNKSSDSRNTINNISQNKDSNKPYGEQIATYAREFYKEYQGKVNYGVDFKLRKKAYLLIPEDDGTFTVDCVGLVNLVVHNATGLSLPDEGEYSGFVIPKGSNQMAQAIEPFEFQDVIYDFQIGDILTVYGYQHEVIYIGNNEILDITPNGLEIKNVREYKYDKRAHIAI